MMLHLLLESALRTILLAAMLWAVLSLLRVHHPQAQSMAWTVVLAAAVAMPALIHWTLIPAPAPAFAWATPIEFSAARVESRPDWQVAAVAGYWLVAAVLLVRQLLGLCRSGLILRRSVRVRASWTAGMNVRVSREILAPATVASTILLPASYRAWSATKRQAVLAHEHMHVRNHDWHVQVLAQLHRAAFWFSPFAWWLPGRLALLSEQCSDDAVLVRLHDRAAYAEILLDFARMPGVTPGIAMARATHVAGRIERILSGHELHAPLGALRRVALACALAPLILIAASCAADDTIKPKSNPRYPLSQPDYPPTARRAGQSGTVILRLHVLESGSVDDVRIKRSSGFVQLDTAAADEAPNWRLDPGTARGRPVPMWGEFAVTFKLTH